MELLQQPDNNHRAHKPLHHDCCAHLQRENAANEVDQTSERLLCVSGQPRPTETLEHTQDTLERLNLSAGLGMPSGSPRRAR